MATAIVLPMRVDDYGRVVTSAAPERVWADRVRSVLNTTSGERTMREDFGSRIPFGLMDAVPEMPQLIEDSVRTAFTQFLPSLTLVSVELIEEDEAEVLMQVVYQIPGGLRPDAVLMPFGGRDINV